MTTKPKRLSKSALLIAKESGRKGGLATFKKLGSAHFKAAITKRWAMRRLASTKKRDVIDHIFEQTEKLLNRKLTEGEKALMLKKK